MSPGLRAGLYALAKVSTLDIYLNLMKISGVYLEGVAPGDLELPCGHIFHVSCIRKLRKFDLHHCPLCRATLPRPEQMSQTAAQILESIELIWVNEGKKPWNEMPLSLLRKAEQARIQFEEAAEHGD